MACSLWYVRFWGKFILTDNAIIANESLILWTNCKRVRDAAFFLIIMLVTFAATL